MIRVALIGAGSLGVQLAHQLRLAGTAVAGFYDDVRPTGTVIEDLGTVLGPIPTEPPAGEHPTPHLLMAIGYNHLERRSQVFQDLTRAGFKFHTLVHSTAWVDPTATLEEGVVLYPGCIIDRHVRIGANVLLNNGCIISHDSAIGEGSFLAPGVVISGNCRIGSRSFMGTGTVVRDGVSTANDCRFGIGSVVLADAHQPGLYFGHPTNRMRP